MSQSIENGDCVGYVDMGFRYGTVETTVIKNGAEYFMLRVQDSGMADDFHHTTVLTTKCWKEERR